MIVSTKLYSCWNSVPKKNLDPQMHVQQENNNATVADEVDPELLAKVLANPEMRALLNSLAKTMK